jgi:HlyD family secretion protein
MTDAKTRSERQAPRHGLVRRFGRIGLLILGLTLVYLLVLPLFLPKVAEPAPSGVSPASEARQVTALGEVLPISDRVKVAAPTGQDAGRIAEIRVAEGARVIRGDVLAVLDTEPVLRAALDQVIADQDARQVALAARTADLDATGNQLEAQVQELTVALDRAQLELDRMTRLRDSGLYEDSALANKRFDVEAARLNLKNTELQLQRNRLRLSDGLRIDEASAKAELASATAARKRAEADYTKARILAPIDGRVLAIFGKLGEQIGTDGFALMGNTQRMIVRAEVYESDIGGVATGQRAAVTSRALTGPLMGTVSRTGVRISDQSILSTDPAAIVDARVIEVWITLDEAASAAMADLTGLQVLVTFARKDDGNA